MGFWCAQQATPTAPPKAMPTCNIFHVMAMRAYNFGGCCQFAEELTCVSTTLMNKLQYILL